MSSFKLAYGTTLEEVWEVVIRDNSEIALERARFDTVKANKGQAVSEFLPEVNVTYQIGRQKNDAVGMDRAELDQMTDQDVKELNFTQPLFNGFQSFNKVKEVSYNIKQAEEYYKNKQNEILFSVTEAFLKLYNVRKIFALKEKNVQKSKEILALIQQRNLLGEVGGNQVIEYQTSLSNNLSEKLTIRKELFKAESEYNNLVGKIDYDLDFPVIDSEKIIGDDQKLVELALTNNHNLRQYNYQIKTYQAAFDQVKGMFSPKAELSASLSRQENVTYLDNRDLKSQAIYVNFSVPLFQKGQEYFGYNQAYKNLEFARQEYKFNKLNLISDVKKTYKEYVFFYEFIDSHKELIEFTRDRITKIKEQVEIGEGDIVDLLSAEIEMNKLLEQNHINKMELALSYYKIRFFYDDSFLK